MEALNMLGLRLKEHIGLEELLGENFNPQLYSLTDSQVRKVNALRDVVQEYVRLKQADEPTFVTNSSEAAKVMYAEMAHLSHEKFWVVFLNSRNAVIKKEMLFKGSLSHITFNVREIVAKALSCDAAGCIVYHNHPSGSPLPSEEDIKQTRLITAALKIIGIYLHDHIVISPKDYYSFADETINKYSNKKKSMKK